VTNRPYLLLKWGTLKGWGGLDDDMVEVLQQWSDLGQNFSAMVQRDTPEQVELICRVIDMVEEVEGEIQNDWSGVVLTAAEAKTYMRDYER